MLVRGYVPAQGISPDFFMTMQKRISPLLFFVLGALAGASYFLFKPSPVETVPVSPAAEIPTAISAEQPETLPLGDSAVERNLIAAGEYLVRQQLANGELAYQVNVLNGERSSTPSNIRLVNGASALYTVCRVSGKTEYCEAGDKALAHYTPHLLSDPTNFKGTCLYSNGSCPLGGAAAMVDAVYKRWQASDSVLLAEHNLLNDAVELGYFIVSMRRPEGGFYHAFDPHIGGTVNPVSFDPSFNGEAVTALLQLYEMTGNSFWLEQAREVNDFMTSQPVTEDQSHAIALAMFARLDALSQADEAYAKQIADLVIVGQIRSLNPANGSIATAAKVEALSALAQAFAYSEAEHEWLESDIQSFITFVQARQFPANDCNFQFTEGMIENYQGGIFNTCEDPSIRVDGSYHWVNALTLYLEYLGMK